MRIHFLVPLIVCALQPSTLLALSESHEPIAFPSEPVAEDPENLSERIAGDPANPELYMKRGRALALLGDTLAAADDFEQVIAIAPTPDAYLERAQTLVAADDGQIEDALFGLDEGLSVLGPVVALTELAIELELKQGNYDAALMRLVEVAANTPRRDPWLTRSAEILEQAGRLDEAQMTYQDALAALETLPSHRRNTRASIMIEDRIHTALDRLSTATR
ncbi:MAG: tetratricopeptide repeat protein [Gammaproteobacteria bacterium]